MTLDDEMNQYYIYDNEKEEYATIEISNKLLPHPININGLLNKQQRDRFNTISEIYMINELTQKKP